MEYTLCVTYYAVGCFWFFEKTNTLNMDRLTQRFVENEGIQCHFTNISSKSWTRCRCFGLMDSNFVTNKTKWFYFNVNEAYKTFQHSTAVFGRTITISRGWVSEHSNAVHGFCASINRWSQKFVFSFRSLFAFEYNLIGKLNTLHQSRPTFELNSLLQLNWRQH